MELLHFNVDRVCEIGKSTLYLSLKEKKTPARMHITTPQKTHIYMVHMHRLVREKTQRIDRGHTCGAEPNQDASLPTLTRCGSVKKGLLDAKCNVIL
jgi:hypothetical protein